MNVAQETLGLRRGSFSLPLSLLMSAFALLIPPENLSILLRRPTERSPTARAIPLVHSRDTLAAKVHRHFVKLCLKEIATHPLCRGGELLRKRRRKSERNKSESHAPAPSVCSLSPVTSSAQ